jgi:hypothetical protein
MWEYAIVAAIISGLLLGWWGALAALIIAVIAGSLWSWWRKQGTVAGLR